MLTICLVGFPSAVRLVVVIWCVVAAVVAMNFHGIRNRIGREKEDLHHHHHQHLMYAFMALIEMLETDKAGLTHNSIYSIREARTRKSGGDDEGAASRKNKL